MTVRVRVGSGEGADVYTVFTRFAGIKSFCSS